MDHCPGNEGEPQTRILMNTVTFKKVLREEISSQRTTDLRRQKQFKNRARRNTSVGAQGRTAPRAPADRPHPEAGGTRDKGVSARLPAKKGGEKCCSSSSSFIPGFKSGEILSCSSRRMLFKKTQKVTTMSTLINSRAGELGPARNVIAQLLESAVACNLRERGYKTLVVLNALFLRDGLVNTNKKALNEIMRLHGMRELFKGQKRTVEQKVLLNWSTDTSLDKLSSTVAMVESARFKHSEKCLSALHSNAETAEDIFSEN